MSIIEADHYSLLEGLPAWRWPNFKPSELACEGTGKLLLDMDALDRLQFLRTAINTPLKINCGYRSPEHNEALIRAAKTPKERPAKNSLHMQGKAFDVSIRAQFFKGDPKRLYALAKHFGFTGFGFYRTFLHIDTGRAREWGTHKGLYV
ncbi:MAG: DUF882 domain-containing protein [Rickettsiales bacterium]|nr:DUF882 domain-containing protein [Rickettsiales bacterium]